MKNLLKYEYRYLVFKNANDLEWINETLESYGSDGFKIIYTNISKNEDTEQEYLYIILQRKERFKSIVARIRDWHRS